MKIQVGTICLKITRNKYNYERFWNPIGMFYNETWVKREGKWYKCYVSFSRREKQYYIQVKDLMITTENSIIVHHEKGIFCEAPISPFKMNLIEYCRGIHRINQVWYELRCHLYKRRNTYAVFIGSFILTFVYYYCNKQTNNALGSFIGNSNFFQSFFLLLNIFTLGSVFFPFTIRKEFSESDLRALMKEELKKHESEKRDSNEIRKRSTF